MYTEYDSYVQLASAIVAQAVEDYCDDLAKLELNPKCGSAALDARRLEKFFHSGWYGALTGLDPDQLMAGARLRANQRAEKKRIRTNRDRTRDCLKTVGEILATLEVQDELTADQLIQVKDLCLEAVALTEEITQMKANAEIYEDEAIRRMGLRKGV